MKVASIITEYNPFHEGHKYHIDQTKKITDSDYIIVVMSGDFTQRGTPAIMDKYARTKQALLSGADLVLELPVYFSTASAEGFAFGAVSILEKLGIADFLVFGSESGNITQIQNTADFLTKEPSEFSQQLQSFLKQGFSFPKAKASALKSFFPNWDETFLSSSNNILGIEYCRALNYFSSTITPMTISRKDNLYNDTSLSEEGKLSSATSIRKVLMDMDIENTNPAEDFIISQPKGLQRNLPDFDLLASHLPVDSLTVIKEHWGISTPVSSYDFSLLLKYKLCMENRMSLQSYLDVTKELSDRIYNHLNFYQDFDSFCNLLKTKELTYSRISRSLLHILLELKKEEFDLFCSGNSTGSVTDTQTEPKEKFSPKDSYGRYARILGFRKSATPLLHEIKKKSSIPLISKLSDSVKELDTVALSMLQKDIQASNLYQSVVSHKFHGSFQNEFQRKLVIM